MRRGKEHYNSKYDEVMRLHQQGMQIREIAQKLDISYSSAYHWIRGLRKPQPGNISDFVGYLEKNGPTAAVDIKEPFPKHNELFLIASRRGLRVKRHTLGRKYAEYGTWYLLEGQESQLEERTKELFSAIKRAKEKLKQAL